MTTVRFKTLLKHVTCMAILVCMAAFVYHEQKANEADAVRIMKYMVHFTALSTRTPLYHANLFDD
jgi:hypothetical protein